MTTLPWTSRPFFGPGDFGIHWGVLRELKNRHPVTAPERLS